MSKYFKTKLLIIFTNSIHKTLHSYNNVFSSNEGVFQSPETLIYILTKMTQKKNFLKNLHITCLHITWLPMWFNMHINVAKNFNINYHVWIMHINWNYELLVMIY